jgi:heat shock protein HslJ
MKTNIFLIVGIALMILLGCKSKQTNDTHSGMLKDNIRNNVDWAGTYIGVVPCADCSGIEMCVTLNDDETCVMSERYQGHGEVYEKKGKINWNLPGNMITFRDSKDNSAVYFNIGENKITMLDLEGKEIKGELADNYILTKINPDLAGKKWKLVELAGKKIESGQEAFIILDAKSNSVNGNLNCNTFTGFYEPKINNRIKFSNLAITQKMCLSMEIEDGLKKALELTDNYSITGDKLILNRARMAPLAVFVSEK